jgi:hypothetical protein
MKEFAVDRAELRFSDAHIADVETQLETCSPRLLRIVPRAVARNRALKIKNLPSTARTSVASKTRNHPRKRSQLHRPKGRDGQVAEDLH